MTFDHAGPLGRGYPRRSPGAPRRRSLAAVMLVAGALTVACSTASAGNPRPGTNAAASVAKVTLRVGDQAGSGSQALLTAAGLIHALPFKVTWSDFTSGPPMLQAMGAGAVDIGSVGNAPPIFAAAGGNKIEIIGALRANPLAAALLVPGNSPVRTISQLRGKRIAVAQGSSANYHIVTVLKKAGLSVHDVTLDYLQPSDALAAFTAGHVDAWDIWSPFTEQAQAKTGARVLVDGTGYGSPYSFTVVSQAALADPAKAAAIRDYLRLLNEAHLWADAHQAAWAQVWSQATGLPNPVMVAAAKDSATTPVPVTPAIITSEQQVADAFAAAGLVPGHVDIAKFATTRFNDIVGSSG